MRIRTSTRAGASLAGCVITIAALTACAERTLPAGPTTVNSGPWHSLHPQQTPTPVPSLGEEKTKGLESTPWQAVKVGGRDVTIRYVAGGGCSTFRGVRVAQTVTSVELWTTVQTDHAARACAADLATGATTIRLDSDLGTRTLLHAPVSEDWKAYIDNF